MPALQVEVGSSSSITAGGPAFPGMLNDLIQWLLVFARVGALLAVLPMFSMQGFPVQLRIGIGILLAVVLAPFLPALPPAAFSLWTLIRLVTVEISVGLVLGFICRLVFFALEAAGAIIATEMGLMMSSEFSQFSGSTISPPAMMLYWMALMLWFSLDLHHWMITAFQRSYLLVPLGAGHCSEALLTDGIRRSAEIFELALQIAAPVLGVSLVISLVFSMLGRAVPQMNVFAESFPVRTLAGCLVFGVTCLFMAQQVLVYLRRLPQDFLSVARLLGSG